MAPVALSQLSTVQLSLSVVATGAPAWQTALALHVSDAVQALPSVHAEPWPAFR
jgi:hypothetical protein